MKKGKFTKVFKEQTVKLVIEQGLSLAEASSDVGVGLSTLSKWVQIFKKTNPSLTTLKEDESVELKRLRRENTLLKMERDLLKKTAVYFVKASTNGVS